MYYVRKMLNHLSSWYEYIKEHILRIFFVFFIFLSAYILFLFGTKQNVMENNVVAKQNILVAGITLDNWFTWFSLVGLICAAIWAIYQFDKGIMKKQQEKAAQIAKNFSEGLLLKCEILNIVYKLSPLNKFLKLNKMNYNLFENFNTNELRRIYSDDSFPDMYRQLESEIDFNTIYFNILKKRISLDDEPLEKEKSKDKNGTKEEKKKISYTTEEARKLFVLQNAHLPFHFHILVDNVLNELEQICMDISSQAAGSKYIYQSLHQVFLRTVRTLSVEISLRNNNLYCEKYYTNIIHVYKEWTHIFKREQKKETKKMRKVNKILNPKIKTV